MRTFFRPLMLVLAATVLIGVSAACNTTEGIGKDTKAAGQGIQDAADRNK